MIFISLILAFVFTFGVLCVMCLLRLEFKVEAINWIFIAVVFVVLFLCIAEKLDRFEFCQSAVLKVCPKGGGEYVR